MKMSELDRAVAIGLTKNGGFSQAKEMVKRLLDQHTPQEKADLLCFQWVMPIESKAEFEQVLDSVVNHENICNQKEADKIKQQYTFKYDNRVKAIGLACYKIEDCLCIAVLYNTDANTTNRITFDTIDYHYGILCYVNNLDIPDFSEAGSVFFKWVGDGYQKV